jgi:hypothetical protein
VIVVVGSRHDRVARSLVEALPTAALCGAEDLTRPGWQWPVASPEPARWVVDGRVVDDHEVTGVLVRRTHIYPEELVSTHPDDRAYLAAESTAFLIFVLSRTAARVVNPVAAGALGDEAIRPERWMPLAAAAGLRPAPLRLRPSVMPRASRKPSTVEVVGGTAFGTAPPRLRAGATALAAALQIAYAAFVFDGQGRLVTVSSAHPPGRAARRALASLLAKRSGG